jgi:hypothetical protein
VCAMDHCRTDPLHSVLSATSQRACNTNTRVNSKSLGVMNSSGYWPYTQALRVFNSL